MTEVWQKIEGDRKCEDRAAVWIVGVWCVSLCYIQFWSTCRCYHAYIWSSMPFWPGKKSLHLMFGVIFFFIWSSLHRMLLRCVMNHWWKMFPCLLSMWRLICFVWPRACISVTFHPGFIHQGDIYGKLVLNSVNLAWFSIVYWRKNNLG